jgi:hypothetical protein
MTHLFKSSPLDVKHGCLVLFMEIFARKFASLPLGTRHCEERKRGGAREVQVWARAVVEQKEQ